MSFFTDFSFWWLIPAVALAVFFGYRYYFRSEGNRFFEGRQRKVLFVLRTVGLTLLFFLLIGLVWETVTYRREKPLFITLTDRSESMLNYRDSSQIGKELNGFKEALNTEFSSQFEIVQMNLGEQVRPDNGNNQFTDRSTDIASALNYVQEHYFNRNIGGITVISDGNYNTGVHPMYEAESMNMVPIFSLGVGDTSRKKDLVLKSVVSNDIAFVNNEFPIQALVAFHKVPVGAVRVNLLENGKQIQTQTIQNTNPNYDLKEVTFTLTAKDKGYHRFTVQVEKQSGEFSTTNNASTCFVEVIDTKSSVLMLASAPHPDIAAIRSVLELDKEAVIQSGITANFQWKNEKPDLVVWYENGIQPNAELFRHCLSRKIPVLLLLGPNVGTNVLQAYGLSLKAPLRFQSEDVYPTFNPGFKTFECTQSLKDLLSKVPPLRTRFGTYLLPNNATVFLKQRVSGIEKNDPLLAFFEVNDVKVGVVLGEGLWRWKMKEYGMRKHTESFEELIQKTTQFLSVKQNKEPLRVTMPKRFNTVEDVLIKAEFYNEAMELITTPDITFQLTRAGGKPYTQHFVPTFNFYELNLGQLKSGLYSWKAIAIKDGKKYLKSGDFAVEDISLEKQESHANWSTLTQLSNQSDAAFYSLKDYPKLMEALKKRSDIATVQYEDNGYQALIDWWWILALLVAIFGSEWFLRRFWGNY